MKEIKLRYVFKHKSGMIMMHKFSIEEIEGGDFVNQSKRLFPNFEIIERNKFTWLMDKNWKEIYEGDIVNAWSAWSNAKCEVKWWQWTARFFLYNKNAWISWNLSWWWKNYNEETVEIIWNIYENPELI